MILISESNFQLIPFSNSQISTSPHQNIRSLCLPPSLNFPPSRSTTRDLNSHLTCRARHDLPRTAIYPSPALDARFGEKFRMMDKKQHTQVGDKPTRAATVVCGSVFEIQAKAKAMSLICKPGPHFFSDCKIDNNEKER